MSYSHVAAENDIRARAAVLAEALMACSPQPEAYAAMRQEFREELSQVRLPPDGMTWFAIERVAGRAGLPVVRLGQYDTPVPAGALVMVSPTLDPPEHAQADVVRALRSACLVIAPQTWGPVLAGLPNTAVDAGPQDAEPTAGARGPRAGR